MRQPMQMSTVIIDNKLSCTFTRDDIRIYSEMYWFATYICPWSSNGVTPTRLGTAFYNVAYSESELRTILSEKSRLHSKSMLKARMEAFTREGWWR